MLTKSGLPPQCCGTCRHYMINPDMGIGICRHPSHKARASEPTSVHGDRRYFIRYFEVTDMSCCSMWTPSYEELDPPTEET